MALSNSPLMPSDGAFSLRDASGSPIIAILARTEGNLKIDGLEEGGQPLVIFEDRGVVYSARKQGNNRIAFSWSGHALDLTHATELLIMDAARKTGAFAAGTSTFASGDGWFLDLRWTGVRTTFGGANCGIRLKKAHIDKIAFNEGSPGMLEFSGFALWIDTNMATGDVVIS